MVNEYAVFITEMLRRPWQVLAFAPSSAGAAKLMTQGLQNVAGPIVEIGPGTGSFTREILKHGIAPERLTCLEMNQTFCQTLRRKFPGVTVYHRPAQDIADIGLSNIGAVISGVPVLARPNLQRKLIGRAFDVMAASGKFVQITYAPYAPISKQMSAELRLRVSKRGTVWGNLPPAHVFVFHRIQH